MLITPPGILGSSSLLVPKKSSLNDKTEFYATLLFTAAAVQTPAWRDILRAIRDAGESEFGKAPFRSPIHDDGADIAMKGWKDLGVVAYLNVKSGEAYPPSVFGSDGLPLTDKALLYHGARCAHRYARSRTGPGAARSNRAFHSVLRMFSGSATEPD
jgi:hypothetical protein